MRQCVEGKEEERKEANVPKMLGLYQCDGRHRDVRE